MVDFRRLRQEDPPHLVFEGRPANDGFDYSRHPIPTVMKLEGDDNFMEWRKAVHDCFTEFGLTHFIDNTDIIPAADATPKVRLQYVRDRSMAYQVLRNSAGPVMDKLFRRGWDDEKDKPQLLYDTIIDVIWVNDRRGHKVASDLLSFTAADFDTLKAFMAHYGKCITKLADIGVIIPDKLKQAILLKALMKDDDDDRWAHVLENDTHAGHLTYDELMELAIEKANRESFRMSAITSRNQSGQQLTVNHSQGPSNTDNAVRVYCNDPVCEMMYPGLSKHAFHNVWFKFDFDEEDE